MRSIERRFKEIAKKPSNWNRPTISSFAMAVAGQQFDANKVYYWFKKLVDPDDYCKNEKKEVLADMIYKINGLTRIKNRG
jgi:hypothetical protein